MRGGREGGRKGRSRERGQYYLRTKWFKKDR